MSNQLIVLITGANQGLGFFASHLILKAGKYHVLVGSRDIQKGKAAVKHILTEHGGSQASIEPVELDVSSDTSISKAAAYIESKFGRLDILINNAGIATPPAKGTTRDHYSSIYNTNVFGQIQMMDEFLPLLRKSMAPGRRAVFVSSGLSSLGRASDKDRYESSVKYEMYRSSKTALNMLMVCYANNLREEGIAVLAVCPGHCATNLNHYAGKKSPTEGAMVITKAALEGENMVVTGTFTDVSGTVPW
ncbi:hypothetical protein MMC19_005522 [Ptychographa xylographoides]|nr:hypothetical protein [Ptychographa xylographoides]